MFDSDGKMLIVAQREKGGMILFQQTSTHSNSDVTKQLRISSDIL